jgi:5'-deoxynucleotidase YfbR-like HD superfamily hydrolase
MSNNPTSSNKGLTLRDRLRSRGVDRWHTVMVNIKQNIAEHSHCLGIISEYLLDAICEHDSKITVTMTERYLMLKYAQLHDLPEVLTGDMSSTFKKYLKKNLEGFADLMEKVEYKTLPDLAKIDAQIEQEHPHLKIVLKMADLLEAYSYFLVGRGLDEQHNDEVMSKLNEYLSALIDTGTREYPQYQWDKCWSIKKHLKGGDSMVIDFERHLDALN